MEGNSVNTSLSEELSDSDLMRRIDQVKGDMQNKVSDAFITLLNQYFKYVKETCMDRTQKDRTKIEKIYGVTEGIDAYFQNEQNLLCIAENIEKWKSVTDSEDKPPEKLMSETIDEFLQVNTKVKEIDDQIKRKISEDINPPEITEKSLEETIQDYMMGDIDNELIILDYLSDMPYTREAVNEIIEAIEDYDINELYRAAFDRKQFLTPEEEKHLVDKFYSKFDIPF